MSDKKSKNSRRRAGEAKHVRIYRYMLQTAAWRSLSCRARCLLIELQDRYPGVNNGELYLSTRDACEALRTGLSQAVAAFRELEDRGFIRPTRKGSFTKRAETRLATCWRLTEHQDDRSGHAATKEFTAWSAPAQKKSTVPRVRTHRSQDDNGHGGDDVSDISERSQDDNGHGAFSAATVPRVRTQLVNHGRGCVSARTAPGSSAQSAPESKSGESARPSERAVPWLAKLPWSRPRVVQVPRGPGATRFGVWLRAERLARGMEPQFLADVLNESLEGLDEMEAGRAQMSARQRRRAEVALAKHALDDVASPEVSTRVLGLHQEHACYHARSGEAVIS